MKCFLAPFSFALCLLFSSPSLAQEKVPELAGRVFQRAITKQEFQNELRLLRIQVNPSFSPRDLWQRYAFLEKARRLRVRVSDKELIQAIGKIVRGHLVRIDAAKGLKGPHSTPENEALYKKQMKELAKNFVFNAQALKRFLKLRKFEQASFERIVRDNLTIQKLLKQQSALWPVKRKAQEQKRRLQGLCQVELLEWKADDHLLSLKAPDEATLKRFYQENRGLYRRPRQLKLKYIERDDDGRFETLAKLRKRWQSARSQGKTVDLGAWLESEDFESYGETPLGSWDSLTLPPAFSSNDFQDIIQRSKTGTVSPPLRFGGKQYLVVVLEQHRPQILSYQALGARSEDGALLRDWRRYHSLNHLYMKTHALRRRLDDAGWSERALGVYKDKLKRLPVFAMGSTSLRSYPAQLLRRCLTMDTGESAFLVDSAQRRLLLVYMRKRTRPSLDKVVVGPGDISRAQKSEAKRWRTQLFLESKGISEQAQLFARSLLAPRSKALVRMLKLPNSSGEAGLAALKSEFNQGAGLNLLALRAKVKGPANRNVYVPSSFAKAAENLAPYQLEGPFLQGELLHLMMTEPMFGQRDSKIARRRVFHIAYRFHGNVKVISDRASALKYKLSLVKDERERLRLFRRFAKEQSEAPTAKLGGYIGQIQIDQEPLARASRRQIALLKAGQRCQFSVGQAWVFLAVLSSEDLQARDLQSFNELLEQAYLWSDSLSK